MREIRSGSTLWIILCVLLTGCATPYSTPLLDPEDVPFLGIRDALDDPRQPPDVLLVHGMCTHQESDLQAANAALARALDMQPQDANDVKLMPLWGAADEPQLYATTLTDGTYSVNTYALLWSPLATRYKVERLCYDVSDTTESCVQPGFEKPRALLNKAAKDEFLDDCLADAVFYLGSEGGRLLRDAARRAVVNALAGNTVQMMTEADALQLAASRTAPFFIVTHSLGSKILADALFDVGSKSAADPMTRALGRTYQVFMQANQLPILSLGVGTVSKARGAERVVTDPAMDALAERIRRGRGVFRGPRKMDVDSVSIVAFSDPNDLLSWGLRDSEVRIKDATLIDIWVSNARTWVGAVENPLTAHVGYATNREVARLIACGWHPGQDAAPCPTPKR